MGNGLSQGEQRTEITIHYSRFTISYSLILLHNAAFLSYAL